MLKLGAELFELLNAKQWVGKNRIPVVYGAEGISTAKIADIENALGFRLPEDFKYLLQNIHDPGEVLFPWSKFEKKTYDDLIAWILHGIEFDIEKNNLWLARWGKKPDEFGAALEIARRDFKTWPRLLPIFGHRFLAAEPCREGNPVFSIMQTDIVYYGADLAHYLVNEFINKPPLSIEKQPIKRIEIWSDFAEQVFG